MIKIKEIKFILDNIKRSKIEEFLEKEFFAAGYSHTEIQRVPLATRIIIYAQKPGMVIGRGGKTIDAMTETLKKEFNIENPQLDVQEIEYPDLDPAIVCKQIVSALERGINYKRVCNTSLRRIMDSGAVGAMIKVSGKIGGEKSRTQKFSDGYLKFAGDQAETLVKKSFSTATVKLGLIGVSLRILTSMPHERAIVDAINKMGDGKEEKENERVKENENKKENEKENENKKERVKEKENLEDKTSETSETSGALDMSDNRTRPEEFRKGSGGKGKKEKKTRTDKAKEKAEGEERGEKKHKDLEEGDN